MTFLTNMSCQNCFIQHVEGREERWQSGWRPNKEENNMSRWGKPIKNKRKTDPRYFLNEAEDRRYYDVGKVAGFREVLKDEKRRDIYSDGKIN